MTMNTDQHRIYLCISYRESRYKEGEIPPTQSQQWSSQFRSEAIYSFKGVMDFIFFEIDKMTDIWGLKIVFLDLHISHHG